MAQCSNCGFDLDELPPPQCPRCRAPTTAATVPLSGPPGIDDGLAAPPEFTGSPAAPPGSTLFGVPQVSDLGRPPGVDTGPPAIGLDDPELPAVPPPRPPAPPRRTGAVPAAIPRPPVNVPSSIPPPPTVGLDAAPSAGTLADLPSPVRSPAQPPRRPPPPRRYGELDLDDDSPSLELDLPGTPMRHPTPLPEGGPMRHPTPVAGAVPTRHPTPVAGAVPTRHPTPVAGAVPTRHPTPLAFTGPSRRPTPLPGDLDLPTLQARGNQDALDLPAPVPRTPVVPKGPPGGGLDLPAPVPRPAAPPAAPPGYGVDLPAPVHAQHSGLAPKAPPPPPAHGQAFATPGADLPIPYAEFDLPVPAEGGYPHGGVPQAPELDLPAPSGLDLPAPAGLDLPAPAGFDLPQPIGLDLEPAQTNLPQPAALDLEPQGGNQLRPAELGVQPAELGVEPANLGVEPANLGVEPRHMGLAPVGAVTADAEPYPEPGARIGGPDIRGLEARGPSRGLLYGGAAIVLVGALGAGLFYAGVFDEDVPPPRGVAKNDTKGATEAAKSDDGGGAAVDMPVLEAKERSDALLAKFREDTPTSYGAARDAAKSENDRLGYAESLLLLSERYGPDTALVAEAEKVLEPYAKDQQPFVLRVYGLLALAKGAPAEGIRMVQGDATRARLYRGWMLLAQGKPAEALTEAQAVLTEDASAVAALHLQHAAGLQRDPSAELPKLDKTAAENPAHPGLQELRLRAGLQLGNLATAQDALSRIQLPEGAPTCFQARRAALEGMLAAAQGDLLKAVAKYDEALALAPKNVDARIGKIRTLLISNDVQTALPEATALADDRPSDPDVALLNVEVSIAAGSADKSLEMLTRLEGALPDRPEVPYFQGQIHAMRAQLDEAKASFAKALEKDPSFYKASLAEAKMLAEARMYDEGITTLDAALRKANENNAPGPVQAQMLNAKADLLIRQGQTTAAMAALDRVLAVDGNNNEAQVLRGQLRLDAGQHAQGRADLMAVYERTGGYPGLAGPLGRILVREGKTDEAAELVGDSADSERAPVDVKLVAARVKLAQGDPEAAKVHLGHVLAQASTNWEAHTLMAQAFLQANDAAEALKRINQARPPEPQAELHTLKGKILEFNGKYEEARPEYLKALKIDSNQHEARFLYGRLLAYAGAAKQAENELGQVVKATGDRFPQAWLNLGRAQRELGENDAATKSLTKATDLDPSLLEGFYLHGRILADRNRNGDAAKLFEKAVETAVDGAQWQIDAWAYLGRVRAKSGQKAAAKNAWAKFLEIAPPSHPSRDEAERQVKTL